MTAHQVLLRCARALAAAAVLSAAASVAAQPMMDPRQASGIPRGEPNDPPGKLTVRVIQGKFETDRFGNSQSKFPPGQLVHLVALAAGGKARVISKPVDDGGRAIFEGLDTSGNESYYAMAVMPRGTPEAPDGAPIDDRLMSQPFTMPPKVGMRMMLAGLDPAATEPGVDDLALRGAPAVAAGQIVVLIEAPDEAELAGVEEVRVLELSGGQAVARSVPTRERGVLLARFGDLPTDPAKVYLVEVDVGGRRYHSTPVMMTRTAGALAHIAANPAVMMTFHAGAELDDDKIWFQVQFTLANTTGSPYNPGSAGIRIPLPRGFVAASVGEQDSLRVTVDKSSGFVWRGLLPPGQESFVGTFALPVDKGVVELEMAMPYELRGAQITMRVPTPDALARVRECEKTRTAGLTADSKEGEESDAVRRARAVCMNNEAREHVKTAQSGALYYATLDSGVSFLVVPNMSARAGDTLRMTFVGLPSEPASMRWARRAVGGAVLAVLALTLVGLLIGRSRQQAVERGTAALISQRDHLYDRLVKLETGHRDGQVPEPRYRKERATLTKKLSEVHEKLRSPDRA